MFINQTKAMSKIWGFIDLYYINLPFILFHSQWNYVWLYGGALINETIFHLTYGGPPKCLYNLNLTLFVL